LLQAKNTEPNATENQQAKLIVARLTAETSTASRRLIVSMENKAGRGLTAHCEQVLMSHLNISTVRLKAGNVTPGIQPAALQHDDQ